MNGTRRDLEMRSKRFHGMKKKRNNTTRSLVYALFLAYAVIMTILVAVYHTKMDGGAIQTVLEKNDLLSPASILQKSRGSSSSSSNSLKPGTHKSIENKRPMSSPYAYAWVIGSIHEDRTAYKGFIYNILIAAKVLREKGSTADFILWAQLSPESKLKGRLPKEDERLLGELGVEIRMLDTVEHESFAQIVYEKFRVLTMTKYKRVMFLDADIMPRTSLDYLFHLSVTNDGSTPLLRPNLILATKGEPCNTALFMVEPSDAGWKLLQDTIARQHREGSKLPYPHFNFTFGWGYSFMNNGDPWQAVVQKKGWRWVFHAGHSDQGLMYYWAKFGMKDTSIIIGDILQNFVPGKNGKHEKDLEDDFPTAIENKGLKHLLPPEEPTIRYNCPSAKKKGDWNWFLCNDMPYKHMIHFHGTDKPWQNGLNHKKKGKDWYSQASIWFEHLKNLNIKYDMNLDVDNWQEKHKDLMHESPFGYIAQYKDHSIIINKSANKTATQADKLTESEPVTPQLAGSTKPPTVAYVVSFIKCSGTATHSAGLVDASLVMRHSIHQISARNPDSGSKYDYKMYAIVHRQAGICSKTLKHAGFEIILVDAPVRPEEIRGDHLRREIHTEFCCGHDEFVKLYAYNKIPEDIFVHVDIDFAFFKPMDHLFDAIMYSKDSEEGKRARSLIERERESDQWPDRIDAFITRDWPQVAPNKYPPGYQAGFIVGRRSPEVFDDMIEVIKEGNYSNGWGWSSGWGNKGYGGYVGAMAMQGFVAYYYDHIRPNTTVELNQCRYNHMGLDVRYNKPPNFALKYGRKGQCRNNSPEDICEDCMVTESEKIYNAHYTMCRKPWNCIGTGEPGGRKPGGERMSAINTDTVHLDHCMVLQQKWHSVRLDMENQLFKLTGDRLILEGYTGTYQKDIFLGHCVNDGSDGYLKLVGGNETFSRFSELYGYNN